jgi:hypothetical protein
MVGAKDAWRLRVKEAPEVEGASSGPSPGRLVGGLLILVKGPFFLGFAYMALGIVGLPISEPGGVNSGFVSVEFFSLVICGLLYAGYALPLRPPSWLGTATPPPTCSPWWDCPSSSCSAWGSL